MASTTFVDQITTRQSSWLNDVNSASYLDLGKVQAGGTSDALQATFVPAITSLTSMAIPVLLVRAASANATVTPTFTPAPGTIAALPITKLNGQQLAVGDIAGAGHWLQLQYDATLVSWELLNPATVPPVASTSPVVSSMRNLKIYQSVLGNSLTMTADELTVETALGGLSTKLANLNQTVSTAVSGIGGMDTGIAPTSGFVYIYEMVGTGQTPGLMGTISSTGSVYTGGHLPAGYAGGSLVSVWAVNGSSQFTVGYQRDRTFQIPLVQVLNTTTTQATPISLSIASVVPPNAVTVNGNLQGTFGGSATTLVLIVCMDTNLSGAEILRQTGTSSSCSVPFNGLILPATQALFYEFTNTAGTSTAIINITGYTI